MARPCLIGIDVGTTSVKAVLIDLRGQVLESYGRPHATRRPRPGEVEQDPDDWLEGVIGALDYLRASHDLSGLRGIGICSQVNTHVFVDAAGHPLLPAFVWQDVRCAPDAEQLDAAITPEQKLDWFGAPMPIDASHALSRMAYVARVFPSIYAETRHVLLPKDYCAMALTGEVAADPIAAVGLVDRSLGYVPELLDLVPGAQERLPPLYDFAHRMGVVQRGLPCAGTPVVVGAMDAWGGMFGVGVISDGEAMYQSGTSEIPGIVSSSIVPTPGVVVFPAYRGIVLHAAPTQSGGAALEWFARVMGQSPTALAGLAGRGRITADSPLFLPHLEGERAPIWDPTSRGVFARLDGATGPGDLARAVMEGVALSVRWAFEALEHSAGLSPATVHIGGGGSRSDYWCQLRADVLGKVLRRVRHADAGTLGAAILAGLGNDVFDSLAAAVAGLVTYDRTFEPDTDKACLYAQRFERYRELYSDLRGFNSRF